MFLRKTFVSSGVLTEGILIFLHPQCPITKAHLRQKEMESYNILNCSNNKTISMEMAFFVIINELLRQGHHNLEFHIVHLLEPAPQTQTATAHLQTTWTVYFDGQSTQKLPCGKIPQGGSTVSMLHLPATKFTEYSFNMHKPPFGHKSL